MSGAQKIEEGCNTGNQREQHCSRCLAIYGHYEDSRGGTRIYNELDATSLKWVSCSAAQLQQRVRSFVEFGDGGAAKVCKERMSTVKNSLRLIFRESTEGALT